MSTPRITERCGLCNFKFCREDIIIVVKEDGEKSGLLPFHSWTRITNDDEAVQHSDAHPVCPDLDQCAHPLEEGVGCHPSCLRIVGDALSLGNQVAVSIVSFESAITEAYTTFEGRKYLHSISNALVSNNSWVPPKVIYVAEDHAGIRQVIFAKCSITVSDFPGVWWKSFPIYKPDTLVFFHNDVAFPTLELVAVWLTRVQGIKLRYLTYRDYCGQSSTTSCLSSFSLPRTPELPPERYLFSPVRPTEPRQMSVFRHSEPGIIGYSICCDPAVLALHTHRRFDDDLSCYESTPENAAWIYMPIEKDERIDRIWMRQHRSSTDPKALAFEMNSGRLLFFGHHKTWALDESKYQWTPLWSSLKQHSSFFFFFDSFIPFCIRELGFDIPCSSFPFTPILTQAPLSRPADSELLKNPHWSYASVEDVVEVVPCRQTIKGETMITGLLLYYSDGNKASVGHMRLDRLDPAIAVDWSQKLHLGFKKTKDGHSYIAKVELSTRKLEDDMTEWFEVSWSGTLEWYFSFQECYVWKSDG